MAAVVGRVGGEIQRPVLDPQAIVKKYETQAAGNRAVSVYNEGLFGRATLVTAEEAAHLRPAERDALEQRRRWAAEKAIDHATEAGSACSKFHASANDRDKFAKFVSSLLTLLSMGVDESGASESTKAGFRATEKWAKHGRSFFAIWNIFAGVMESIGKTLQVMGALVSAFVRGDLVIPKDTLIKQDKEGKRYYELTTLDKYGEPERVYCRADDVQNDDGTVTVKRVIMAFNSTTKSVVAYVGRKEHFVGFFAMFGQLFGAITYTGGFGVWAPLKCFDDLFKGELGKATSKMAKDGFAWTMGMNHLAVAFGNIWDGVKAGMDYSKAKPDDESALRKFIQDMVSIVTLFLEKVLEIGSDLFIIYDVKGPPIWKALLLFGASTVSFGRSIRSVNLSMEGAIRKKAEENHKAAIAARVRA